MFVAIWQFLKSFFLDPTFFVSRMRALGAAMAAGSFFGSSEIADAIGNPAAVKWFKAAGVVIAIIVAAAKAGEKNDHGEAIAEKLRAEGYEVKRLESSAPPAP